MGTLAIPIPGVLVIDAGGVTEDERCFTIHPPGRPMIDQLIEHLAWIIHGAP